MPHTQTPLADKTHPPAGRAAHKLLIVGPLPPPIGGSPLTLVTMLKELENYPDIRVTVINSSPVIEVNKKMTGFNLEKVRRMFRILVRFPGELRDSSAAIVFANDLFAIVLVPFLFGIARLYRKPFYLKPVGSGLDLYMENSGKFLKSLMLKVLRSADGIFAQTQYLTDWLKKEGCEGSFYLPGCRPFTPIHKSAAQETQGPLRLVFVAHVTRLKGPLVLLEALQIIARRNGPPVMCDFYGPIHDDVRDEFLQMLAATPHAAYQGVIEVGKATQVIAEYDALVLPTCYDTEGHPGVLIEAMHAGVPAISTQIRTLPELIQHNVNGLLVPVGEAPPLADAIEQLARDENQRLRMGQANFQKGYEFRADVVVAKMVKRIFPQVPLPMEAAENAGPAWPAASPATPNRK